MTKKQLLKLVGGARAVALMLGISTQAVAKWDRKIPTKRLDQIRAIHPEWFT